MATVGVLKDYCIRENREWLWGYWKHSLSHLTCSSNAKCKTDWLSKVEQPARHIIRHFELKTVFTCQMTQRTALKHRRTVVNHPDTDIQTSILKYRTQLANKFPPPQKKKIIPAIFTRRKRKPFNFNLQLIMVNVLHCEAKELHPCSFCNNLIKLRSSMPIFCKQLPECICNKTV